MLSEDSPQEATLPMRAVRARAEAQRQPDEQVRERKRQRREALLIPAGIALISRAVVLVAADLLLRFGLANRPRALPFTGPFSVWQLKDALWYIAIAQSGYNYSPVAQSRANFFPLYPALIHVFEPIVAILPTSQPYGLTGMIISWLTFAGACIALYSLTLDRFGRDVAIGAVMLLAVFPFGLYYGAAYTESIYLVLAVGAFLAIDRRQWWIAAALAGIASASRPPGLLIGACVALAYLLDWYRSRHPLRLDVLSLALTPVGILAYLYYCWVRWGDPLAYVKTSQAGWNGGRVHLSGMRYIAHVLLHPVSWLDTWDPNHYLVMFAMLLMLGFLALTPLTVRLLGPVYGLLIVASILSPVLDFPFVSSLGRYLSVIFPVFIVLAYLLRNHRVLRWSLYVVGSLLLILFSAYFLAGFGLA